MSARVIKYKDAIKLNVKVNGVYLDTSFLVDLFRSMTNPAPSESKFKDTKSFHEYLSRSSANMWTSYAAIEEFMFISFKARVRDDIRATERVNGLTVNSLNYSNFKRNYKADFNASYNINKGVFNDILQGIIALDIKIAMPRDFSTTRKSSKGLRIARYAKCLLEKYIFEVADAFHVSVARCNGTKIIATNDFGFKQIDGFTVFSFR